MPLPLSGRTLTHGTLERTQLSDVLQILDGMDSLCKVIRVRVAFRRFIHDRFDGKRIFLEML